MTALRTAVLAAAVLIGGSVHAQPANPAELLRAVREATERLDYATAEARAREALARYEAFAPDQLVEIHTTLGVLLAARNDDIEARRQFEAALSLDPAQTLDPVLVPPKTVALFEAVRRDVASAAGSGAPPVLRYVVLPDRRPGAAWRSAVAPGWGQFYKGDRGRGTAFAIGVGVAAVGAAAAQVAYARARERYAASATPTEAYPATNRLLRLRNGLALGMALGWAAGVAEALVTGAPRLPASAVAVRPAGAGVELVLRF